ncbi:MAG: TOBE domain-containing protein [Blastocatellia bacterium]|nr:TOBE domain-containing protein [Blastocatellia bacterium]
MSLVVDKVSKRYKNDWVLKDVSFEAAAGEVFGIFAASGVGKSTLLRSIQPENARNGGTVTSADGAAKEFVSIPGSAKSPSFFRRLFGSSTRPESSASAGEIRNLMESGSLHSGSVLLLDDPFCSLDLAARLELFDQVRSFVKEMNIVAVFATSRFDDILPFCDRAAVLTNGGIAQIGSPQDVYERPATAAVARMVGRNNVFAARRLSSSKADSTVFVTIDGEHRLTTRAADIKTLGPLNQNILLCIRPEQISISFGASFPEDNLIKGKIEGIQQLGHFAVISLSCEGLALTASVPRVIGLNRGDECMVGLPPDRIRIFSA